MSIDSEKTTAYWLESSEYDLDTGATLLRSKKFPYALFFGHLAIEKLLKAIVVKHTGGLPPIPILWECLPPGPGLSFLKTLWISWQNLWSSTRKHVIRMPRWNSIKNAPRTLPNLSSGG